jgi:hypothetical protein
MKSSSDHTNISKLTMETKESLMKMTPEELSINLAARVELCSMRRAGSETINKIVGSVVTVNLAFLGALRFIESADLKTMLPFLAIAIIVLSTYMVKSHRTTLAEIEKKGSNIESFFARLGYRQSELLFDISDAKLTRFWSLPMRGHVAMLAFWLIAMFYL